MSHPIGYKVLATANVAGWVAAAVVSFMYVSPTLDVPWYLQHLREPVAAGIMSCVSFGLIAWKFSAPLGYVWKFAYQAGLDDGRNERVDNVVPMRRRQSSSV